MSFMVEAADLSSPEGAGVEAASEGAPVVVAVFPPQPARTADAAMVPKAARNSRRFMLSFMVGLLPCVRALLARRFSTLK